MGLVEISVEVDWEAAEAVYQLFDRYVPGGAVVEQVFLNDDGAPVSTGTPHSTVKVYLPESEGQIAVQQALEEALQLLSQTYALPSPRISRLADEDWAHAWKRHFTPQRVGRRLVVLPSWLDYAAGPEDVVLRLDPGMAFGTGLHPTTRMCCLALEELLRPGDRVLDVGTGSGILAIAAARLGARHVRALDVAEEAVRAARENVARNGVQDVVGVAAGSPGQNPPEPGTWDLVLANILAEVIVELAPVLAACLAPRGHLVASGILADQEGGVLASWLQAGLEVVARYQEGDWVTLVGQEARDQ